MQLALADAAPADRVQVVAVDQPAERTGAPRLVAVDVVEGRARIEAGAMAERDALGQRPAEAHVGAHHGPVEAARRQRRQRRGEPVGLVARVADPVGVEQRRRTGRLGEPGEDEVAGLMHRDRPVLLAKRVVKEAGQHMTFLDRRSEPLEEPVLRPRMDHPVGARDQQLRRHGDRPRVGHDALGSLVQLQQDVRGDRPGDQRVGIVGADALRIVRQELRLDVAIDEKLPLNRVAKPEQEAGEGHVQLDLEGRRGEHHAPDVGRVIVRPGRDQHRSDALPDDGDVPRPDAVSRRDVLDEALHVAHRGAEARAVARARPASGRGRGRPRRRRRIRAGPARRPDAPCGRHARGRDGTARPRPFGGPEIAGQKR